MTRRSAVFLFSVVTSGAVTFWTGQTATAAPASVLSALPADTVLVIQVPHMAQLSEKIKASPLGKIAELPDVSPLIEAVKSHLDMVRAKARAEVGFDPWDIISSIEGEIVVAYGNLAPLEKALSDQLSGLQPQVSPEAVSLVVCVDAGSSRDKIGGAVKKLIELGRKERGRVASRDFHGGRLTTIRPPEGQDRDISIHVAEHGTRFLLGFSEKFMEEIVANVAASKTTGLAGDEKFESTFRLTGSGDFFLFVNIQSITRSLGNALNATFFGFFWQKFQSLVFGRSLNNLGMGAGIDRQGLRQTIFFHNSGADDGILGWLRAPEIEPRPPAFTPETANMVSSVSISLSSVVSFLEDLLRTAMSLQGGGADPDMLLQAQFGVKLSDLKRAFGTRVDMFSTKVGDMENPFGDLTLLVELKDAGPARELMKRAIMMAPGSLVTQDYQGYEVHAAPAGGPISPAVCITDTSLIFSFEAENVRKVLRGLKNSTSALASRPSFKKAATGSPGKVNLFQYQSTGYGEQVEQVYTDAIEQLAMGMKSAGMGFLPGNTEKALVAALKALVETFGDAFGWGKWRQDGFYIEGLTPFK